MVCNFCSELTRTESKQVDSGTCKVSRIISHSKQPLSRLSMLQANIPACDLASLNLVPPFGTVFNKDSVRCATAGCTN